LVWPLPSARAPRFVPRGIDFDTLACPEAAPKQMGLKRHALLDAESTTKYSKAPPRSDTGSCQVRDGTLAMRNACLRDSIFYLRTGGNSERLIVRTPRWGPWGANGRAEPPLYFQPWRHAARGPPEGRIWLRGAWLFAQPRLNFSPKNVYHSLDEIEKLDGIARRADMRLSAFRGLVTLNRGGPLLNGTLLGALIALAMDAFHMPPKPMPSALCFDTVVLEIDQNVTAAASVCTSRLDQGADAAEPPLREPPGAGDCFLSLTREAYTQLRLHGAPPRSTGSFQSARVLIIHRLSSRRLVNLPYLAYALLRAGMDVTIAAFECLELKEQIALVSRASTLVGAHGAALSLGRFLPDDGAIIELRSSPCVEDDQSWMGFRSRFAVIGAPPDATVPDIPCPLWRAKTGMPFVVGIVDVIHAVRVLDRVACRHSQCSSAPPGCLALHATRGTSGLSVSARKGELRPGVPLVSARLARLVHERSKRQEQQRAAANSTTRWPTSAIPLSQSEGWVQPWRAWDICRSGESAAPQPSHSHSQLYG
jgi:hypothetical protein